MKVSQKGIDLIKSFEGCRLKAYLDSANIPTIGYGCIMYPTGVKVKLGEVCTQEEAEFYLKYEISLKSGPVNSFFSNVALTQNQFDAVVSFAYNCGVGALRKSTLLKKILANPNDPSIELEFMKWTKAGGKEIQGLVKRRQAESDLYFS